ncbi:MAG: septum site-determining protein MinD [Candidatus Melainabacteria bacterium]|jgi:septum site-determining protein MinD|nr:septum site-determining protein MinD [Candidatus Melainabacteria bacterium]
MTATPVEANTTASATPPVATTVTAPKPTTPTEKRGKVIVVTSGKGGVGKTTTTANIGTGLAKLGYKVVLVDTDIGLRNLDILMGLENRIVYNLIDVIEGRCRLNQALVKDKRLPNLCLLPAAQTRDKSALNEEQMIDICNRLREDQDFILLDCPAGIEQGFQTAIAAADEAVVVVTPEMSSVRDADRVIGLLEAKDSVKRYRLVLNRVRPQMVKANDMMSVDDVLEILGIELLGQIPEDKGIIVSTNKGEPVVNSETNLAGQAYRNVARRITGETVPWLQLDEPTSWLEKLKNFLVGNDASKSPTTVPSKRKNSA